MSVFKKQCFVCGKKDDVLYEQQCEDCFTQNYPPIKEIKPLSLKIDNITGDISYNNHYYSQDEFFLLLPKIMKKNIVLHPRYSLKQYAIEDIHIKGHRLFFDVVVECDLKKNGEH